MIDERQVFMKMRGGFNELVYSQFNGFFKFVSVYVMVKDNYYENI